MAGFSSGFGLGLGGVWRCTFGAGSGLACAISLRWRSSSSCTRRLACASDLPGSSGWVTGSGVLARTLRSVLPPRSRFACARASALAGASLVFALTRMTSRGVFGEFQRRASGNVKCTVSRPACRARETTTDACSAREFRCTPVQIHGRRYGSVASAPCNIVSRIRPGAILRLWTAGWIAPKPRRPGRTASPDSCRRPRVRSGRHR